MKSLRALAFAAITGTWALFPGAQAATLETEFVDMEFSGQWTFGTNQNEVMAVSEANERVFIKIVTMPRGLSLGDKQKMFEQTQADMQRYFFDGPKKSSDVRFIVPHTTASLPGSVTYSEMVYGYENAALLLSVFTAVRGYELIIALPEPLPEANGLLVVDQVRSALKNAKWK
jgi:hypothetical protein